MTLANIFLAKFYTILLFVEPEKSPSDTLLSVEPGLIIWTIIIFILLLYLLKKTAWKPLLKSLSNREQLIRDSVEKAETLRQEAERMLEENKKVLAKADEESRRIINEGKEFAEKLRNELISKTNEDTNRMVQQAKADIEREKLGALNELKGEIASLAIQAASKIIDENLDDNKQKKIISKFAEQIPKN
ncbi:MAG: ATP synthase F0 subunit B [Ignavibacteriae bacterium]|nr:MAG: ATP synthase F0 subunit B [Ignavibacteriota bacterium]